MTNQLQLAPGWTVEKVGALASFSSGEGISVAALQPRSHDFPVPVYGGNGVAGYTSKPCTEEPTIVIGRVGQRCGEVHFTDGPAWITDNALYPKRIHRALNLRFLGLALSAAGLNDVKNRNDLPLVTQSILHAVEIPWPADIREQAAIASALSDVDSLLEALDGLIVKKRDLVQAAMQRLLTGQTRLPGFSGKWEAGQIAQIADVDPEHLGANTSGDFAFQYISLEDVDRGALLGHAAHLFRSAPSRARRVIRRDDVLVSTVRPSLQSHLWFKEMAGNWICSTGFAVIRCRDKIGHPGFIFAHLFSDIVGRQIEALLTGSNYPAISSSDVRKLVIPVPPFDEQRSISDVLADMNNELITLERRREKSRLLKQGMMQELLSGRTRLV